MNHQAESVTLPQLGEKVARCSGCRDNFYNSAFNGSGTRTSPGGHCWSLPKAELRWRWAIGMQTPMDTRERFRRVQVYDCFHGEGPYRDIYLKRLPAHLGGDWADQRDAAVPA